MWVLGIGIPFIRQLEFAPLDIGLYNDMDNQLLSRSIQFTPFGFDTTTGERFSFNIETTNVSAYAALLGAR